MSETSVRELTRRMKEIAAGLPPDFDWEQGVIEMDEDLIQALEAVTGISRYGTPMDIGEAG